MSRPLERIKQTFRKIKSSIFQVCPPELTACEFSCDKLECSNEEWLTCEHRLSVAAQMQHQLESGDEPAQL